MAAISISDCGVMLEPQLGMSAADVVSVARSAEDLGFGFLFRSDHLLPTDGRRGIDSPECWTTLAAVAASTKTIGFGPMVSPIGFRNPALLAKMACTVHSLSGGRLMLALGAGWYQAEYAAHGYAFPDFKTRVGQFREALSIICSLVRDGRADFDGKHFSVHTDCLPRPTGRMHVIVGGKSKPTVRAAGRTADEWNVFVSPRDQYIEMKRVFDEAREGRKVRISETGPYLLGRNQAELERNAEAQARKFGQALPAKEVLKRLKDRGAVCGTVDEFRAQVRDKTDAGVERFYFQTLVPENRSMTELLADTIKAGL